MATVAELLEKSVLLSPSIVSDSNRKKRVIGTPCIHYVSHRLKKVGVDMVIMLFLRLPLS